MYRHSDLSLFGQICDAIPRHIKIIINISRTNTLLNFLDSTPYMDRIYALHLKEKNINDIKLYKSFATLNNIKIGYSAHNLSQLNLALSLGADYCTLSPIFPTPNKNTPLGIEIFKNLPDSTLDKIVALGGIITKQHIDLLKASNIKAFASIRYFNLSPHS